MENMSAELCNDVRNAIPSGRTRAMILYVGGMMDFLSQEFQTLVRHRRNGNQYNEEYCACLERMRARCVSIFNILENENELVHGVRTGIAFAGLFGGDQDLNDTRARMRYDARRFIAEELEELRVMGAPLIT